MAKENHKIGFYNLLLRRPRTEDEFLDPILLFRLFAEAASQAEDQRIMDVSKEHRFHLLEFFGKNLPYIRLLFGSGRYRHRPPLRHRKTAILRDNPKTTDEGDNERTHMVLHPISAAEGIDLVMEEKRGGLSRSAFVAYIRYLANKFGSKVKDFEDFIPVISVLGAEDFWDQLDELNRASHSILYTSAKKLGSEALQYFEPDRTIKGQIKVEVVAEKGESLREKFMSARKRLEQGTSKIRIVGTNDLGNRVILDTDFVRSVDYLEIEVDDATGATESQDFFKQMETQLKEE